VSVDVRDLVFAYPGAPVLGGITAVAATGRITAVLGPNAAGKSTLLRCAIGALVPGAGAVLVQGTPAHRLRGRALATRIAYVAQRSAVAAPFTVREVIEIGRYALPRDPRRITDALARLDLAEVADRPYPALSVGQQQRVAVARAVAQAEPGSCLVLDEPTASMDLRHAGICFAVLRDLAAEGMTVLLAMHDLGAAASIADDAWLLDPAGAGIGEGGGDAGGRGGGGARLAAAGPVAEVMETDRLARIFGVPFAWVDRPGGGRVLVSEIHGCRAGDRAVTIAGTGSEPTP